MLKQHFTYADGSATAALSHLQAAFSLLNEANPLAAHGLIPIIEQAASLKNALAPLANLVADDE